MKDYIVAFEISKVRDIPKVLGDFDTKQQAEDWMVRDGDAQPGEVVTLKRQSRNQWWSWDFATGQGWEPLFCGDVEVAKAVYALALKDAQNLVNESRKLEVDDPDVPTHDVNWTLRHSRARLLKAKSQMVLELAEIRLLGVVLEAHGNVEWPIVD